MSTLYGDIAALLTAVLWANAVICFRLATFHVGSIAINLFKTVLAFSLFLILLLITEHPPIPTLPAETWVRVFISAILGITLGDVLYIAALQRLGATLEALVACLYSPFIVIMAYFLFGETLSVQSMIGTLLVVAAVVIASVSKGVGRPPTRDLILGIIFGALSELTMCYGVLMIRDVYRTQSILPIVTVRFGIGSLSLIVWGVLHSSRKEILAVFKTPGARKWMFWATVLGPFIATLCWFMGFKYTSAARAAVFNQLSTVFIILLAAMFLKEPLTRPRLIAIVLAFTGALLV